MARAGGAPPKQISENALYLGLRKSWHIHPCSNRACRQILECTGHISKREDFTRCTARLNDQECHDCRGLLGRPIWMSARDSVACCVGNVKQLTYRNELLLNKLAGPGPWYLCKTCARPTAWPLGYNPDRPTPTEKRNR